MEMSITKALRELKTLDSRILKKINEATFVTAVKSKETIRGYKTKEDFEKAAGSSLQSIQELMENRKKIKKAIVESNASTIVEVAGKPMTVADAIERKNFIEVEKNLLRKMFSDFSQSQIKMDTENNRAQTRLDNQLTGLLSKEANPDVSELEGFKKLFWSTEETMLIDPIDSQTTALELEKDIETFENEVDVALQEINARTNIIFL